jgi:hypothetical protein
VDDDNDGEEEVIDMGRRYLNSRYDTVSLDINQSLNLNAHNRQNSAPLELDTMYPFLDLNASDHLSRHASISNLRPINLDPFLPEDESNVPHRSISRPETIFDNFNLVPVDYNMNFAGEQQQRSNEDRFVLQQYQELQNEMRNSQSQNEQNLHESSILNASPDEQVYEEEDPNMMNYDEKSTHSSPSKKRRMQSTGPDMGSVVNGNGNELAQICKEALFGGWIKVTGALSNAILEQLRAIGIAFGLSEDELSKIKLSTKVSIGTNGKRGDYKRLQETRRNYLERSIDLIQRLLRHIDEAFNLEGRFLENLFRRYIYEANQLYESCDLQEPAADFDPVSSEHNNSSRTGPGGSSSSCSSSTDPVTSSPTPVKRHKNNKCRIFRGKYLKKDDLKKEKFGYDITRVVKGGNWGCAESKEILILLKAILDLLNDPILAEMSEAILNALKGAFYVVACHGEHNPYPDSFKPS